MATITSAGVGSGLDIEGLISKLMAAERQPLVALQVKQKTYEAKISAYGRLNSALSTFRTSVSALNSANDFKLFSTKSTSESVVTATNSISASPGNYSINVSRIAEQHKKSAGTAYADTNATTIGVNNDFMTIDVGSASFKVEVGGKTLDQIISSINTSSDIKGVTASIINTDVGNKLVLTANETGSGSFLNVSYGIDPFELADISGGAATSLSGSAYYADSNTTAIGRAGDTMTFTIGAGAPFSVDIGNKTLDQVASAINADVNNAGQVTAVVESTASGYRLNLTAGSAITTSYATTSNLNSLFSFADVNTDRDASGTFTATDLDAVFTIDGSTVTRKKNSVDDVITGLTLNLQGAGASTLTVSRDNDTAKKNIETFVKAYNTLQDSLDSLNKAGLYGESSVRNITTQIKNVLNDSTSGLAYTYLTEVGIQWTLENRDLADGTTQKVSRLKLDSSALNTALTNKFSDVSDLFTNTTEGFGKRLDDLLKGLTGTDGMIDTRRDGINDQIALIKKEENNLSGRLTLIEERYRKQFTALDILVSNLQSTSNFLTQQLASIPKVGG